MGLCKLINASTYQQNSSQYAVLALADNTHGQQTDRNLFKENSIIHITHIDEQTEN